MIDKQDLLVPIGPSQPLDLTSLAETATIQPHDLALALWVLSVPQPPSRIILPESLLIRRRLARSGLVFAADQRGIDMEIGKNLVSVTEALGLASVHQTLALENYDLETSDRMRVVSSLKSQARRPPAPDPTGRRYYWIDGLHVAAAHPRRDSFDRHADQCFFELVDNVHRWSNASKAVAIVSATSGGGKDSHNRLQIVVIDNGIGILKSVKMKAEALIRNGLKLQCVSNGDKGNAEIAIEVVNDLLCSVYRERGVIGAQGGHGLNTVSQHVSSWKGTMNVISSFAPHRAIHLGRRGREGEWNRQEFTGKDIQGTVVQLTLDALTQERFTSPKLRHREPATV